jgi:hypothetical protein
MTIPVNPYVAGNPVGDSPALIGQADVLQSQADPQTCIYSL